MSHVNINLAEFLSVLVFLSEECGKIIRQVESSGELKQVKEKNDKSPVTNADLRVQKTLEVVLKALYPTLAVEGEESKESIADKESAVNPEQVTDAVKKFINTEWLNKKHTIFGKVVGETIYNLINMDKVQTDKDGRPKEEMRILGSKVIVNPFADIAVRNIAGAVLKG